MTKTLLQGFEEWFAEYVKDFTLEDPLEQRNIDLKIHHTYRVKEAAVKIGKQLSLSNLDMLLFETIALFHDLGRFPQYYHYKTYKDQDSKNHAELSVKELKKHGVLEILPYEEQELIYTAIMHHNIAHLPENMRKDELFFSKLLRDADKVDILYVVTEHYKNIRQEKNTTVHLGLDESPEISDHILDSFLRQEIILVGDMHYVNDFKVMQLAWVNDLNFAPSLQLIIEANYFETIIRSLPEGDKREKISEHMHKVIEQKLGELV